MKGKFLVGDFLPGYSDAFRYPDGLGRSGTKPNPEWLAERFARRSARHQSRGQQYALTMQAATVFSLLLVIGTTMLDIRQGSPEPFAAAEQERVELQDITQTIQKFTPPPPPRPAVPVVVADDVVLEDDVLDFDAALDLNEAVAAGPPPPPPAAQEEEVEAEPEVFVVVEEFPEMIGGAAELAKAVKYPSIAMQAGIEGMVIVKVIITPEGRPESPEILRSPSSVLEEAAIEAVMMQRFKPGRQRGRAVACYMSIPVRFQLTSSASL